MTPTERLLIVGGVLLSIAIGYALVYRKDLIQQSFFLDKHLLERGMDRPVIWLYYDQSEVSSKNWLDFHSRSSRALSTPLLNLCYESIVQQNNTHYRVEVIQGLTGVAEILGGWDQMPQFLRDPIAPVGTAELDFIRASVLAKKGGLWMDPASIALRPFQEQPKDKAVFFGMDNESSYSGSSGTVLPSLTAMWSPRPEHPLFLEWAQISYTRVNEKRGGEQIRGDSSWDLIRLMNTYKDQGIIIDPHAEGSRTTAGKRIQLEDLFGSTLNDRPPFEFSSESSVVYVPLHYQELQLNKNLQWVLRSSEQQLLESDLVITHLLKKSQSTQSQSAPALSA